MAGMTYRELGSALGISPDAARIRAKRHKLKVRVGKDGVALIDVPEGYIGAPSRHRRKAIPQDVLAATKAHVTDLQAALDRERKRADDAEAERKKLNDVLIGVVLKGKP